MAGNAIGLGNFLRFPGKAVQNGGGVFLIPYFIALLLLGIPMMWIELSMGRYGGLFLHGTAPGVFNKIKPHPISKYLGVGGLLCPFVVAVYYTYIESWCLGYAIHSLRGTYYDAMSPEQFINVYLGLGEWHTVWGAFFIYLFVLCLNVFILSRGVVRGIEYLAKIALPTLFICAFILMFRILTLGTPDPAHPENSIGAGIAFLWNPHFSELRNAKVWLEATGQIFFTLSIGFGVILTYASYLRERDDIALTGLTSAMTNEFAEVILGSSIVIPAAFVFLGPEQTMRTAESTFSLGFVSMPHILGQISFSQLFGAIWFLLLFFAGITSSVALAQPIMAFLQDELRIPRQRAAVLVGVTILLCGLPVVFLNRLGFIDEIDFWVGTMAIVFFSFLEVVYFVWFLGPDRAWSEINKGAQIRVPRIYYWIIGYVTPVYLLVLMVAFVYQKAPDYIFMQDKTLPVKVTAWAARGMLFGLLVLGILLIRYAWKQHGRRLDLGDGF